MKGFMEGERDNGSLTCLWSKNLPTYEDHRDLHGSCTTSQAILEIVIARHSPPGVHFRPRLPSLSVILTMNRGGSRRSTHKKLLKKMSKGQPMHVSTTMGRSPCPWIRPLDNLSLKPVHC